MAKDKRMIAIGYAILAAVFYAVNVPVSKVLLREVGPTTMAALLYLGNRNAVTVQQKQLGEI